MWCFCMNFNEYSVLNGITFVRKLKTLIMFIESFFVQYTWQNFGSRGLRLVKIQIMQQNPSILRSNCAILSSFKIMIILKELTIAQLCSSNERILVYKNLQHITLITYWKLKSKITSHKTSNRSSNNQKWKQGLEFH